MCHVNRNCKTSIAIEQKAVEKSMTKRQTKSHSFGIKGLSAALLVGGSLLSAIGCQKAEQPPVAAHDVGNDVGNDHKANAEAAVPTGNDAAVSTPQKTDGSQMLDNNGLTVAKQVDNNAIAAQGETTSVEDTDTERVNAQDKPALASDEAKVFLEKQITAVEYRNNSGNSIKVTFQTSALAALEADVVLPSGKRILLTAPKDEGNNPTYRSSDGSVELVTHGGGGSIDLVFNGKSSSFDAVSAEAEVVAPPK